MSNGYAVGRRVEWAVIHDLRANGYDTIRASSSKGIADCVAIKQGQALFVSVKRTTMPGPKERAELVRIAACIPREGVPIVALKPLGHARPIYRVLTGIGPKDWEPWSPDGEQP
jgi:Holliday junction resolvase